MRNFLSIPSKWAEGLGHKLLLTPSADPHRAPEKQTVGTVTISHKMLPLQALSSSLNAGTAKRGCLGRGEAFGCPPAVCPPKRPCPFAHYRSSIHFHRLVPRSSSHIGHGPLRFVIIRPPYKIQKPSEPQNTPRNAPQIPFQKPKYRKNTKNIRRTIQGSN